MYFLLQASFWSRHWLPMTLSSNTSINMMLLTSYSVVQLFQFPHDIFTLTMLPNICQHLANVLLCINHVKHRIQLSDKANNYVTQPSKYIPESWVFACNYQWSFHKGRGSKYHRHAVVWFRCRLSWSRTHNTQLMSTVYIAGKHKVLCEGLSAQVGVKVRRSLDHHTARSNAQRL